MKVEAEMLQQAKEHQRLLANPQKPRGRWGRVPHSQLCSAVRLGLLNIIGLSQMFLLFEPPRLFRLRLLVLDSEL